MKSYNRNEAIVQSRLRDIAIYQHTFLIYNPAAGTFRRGRVRIEQVVEALRARPAFRQGRVTSLATSGPNTAAALAARAVASGADLVLAAGGDGTINEVLNGMVSTGVPLGILPGGTANVLACEMGLPLSMIGAAERIHECEPETISLGLLRNPNPRYFLLMAGIGLDASIIYDLDIGLKARLGKLAYWVAGFSQVGRRLPEFDAEALGRRRRISFALASRVRNYGGDLEIARQVTLFDDDFELILFEGQTGTRFLKYFAGIAMNRLNGMVGVDILRTSSAAFSLPADSRVHVQVDGEYSGGLPATLEIASATLTLLIPPAYKKRKLARRSQEWITSLTH